MMTARGSPSINLMQSKLAQKKISPKGQITKRRGASKARASWSADMEKTLVDLLHEHNIPQYRGQNVWSSDAWNKIVKKFKECHPYVNYTKGQIQDKEKELKREYRMLKEVRQQSGIGWNETRWKIEADEPLWDNLIMSFPKIGKFRIKAFPLFNALGELYDGQTAEGTYNFTSTEPSQQLTNKQVEQEESSVHEEAHPAQGGCSRWRDVQGGGIQVEQEESSVDVQGGGMQEGNLQENLTVHEEAHPAPAVSTGPTSTENEPKRRRNNGDIAAMMEKYIEMNTKQIEGQNADLRTVDEFSIKNCITRLNTMQVSQEEKVKALRVFKNAENRELFICAVPETALLWLRSEMA